jgi:hypothetical protein
MFLPYDFAFNLIVMSAVTNIFTSAYVLVYIKYSKWPPSKNEEILSEG